MAQPRSGWLTIMPSGRWFLKSSHLQGAIGRRKQVSSQLGPYSLTKKISIGSGMTVPGRIRTKVRWITRGDRLSIGPIIGILTVGDGENGAFRGNRENFKDIFLSGKKLGALVYVFTPDGIDWETKKVRGFLYDEHADNWLEHTLPFPHVVYNRIPTRKLEKRSDVSETLNLISSTQNVTLFNRRFFNKLTLFTTLQVKPDVASYLPDTKKLKNMQQLKSFCDTYSFLYLKPVYGKAGEGIMRLEKRGNRWCLKRVHEQQSVTQYFRSLEQVWAFLKKRIKQKPYLIQQGIPLSTYQGLPFDVRVLVQKNGSGEWGVTGIGLRRAGARSITTHVPRGGSILSSTTVLKQLFPEKYEELHIKIENAALQIAGALAEELDSLAEMSMDLGLTQEGDLWFFEANAKPEKFDEPFIRRNSLANLIHYSQYVTNYLGTIAG